MTIAVNYARHDKLGDYVFLAPGEKPDPAWLTHEWAWHTLPSPWARQIGETYESACVRSQHGTRSCGRCRAELAGKAIARRDAR